jgi:hypothetical protein
MPTPPAPHKGGQGFDVDKLPGPDLECLDLKEISMRLTTIGAALVVAGCAGTQTADTTAAAKRACGGISCFYEREVRDFEVVNHTTLIVYVGPERCPYQVELQGTFCDMEFAGDLFFNSPSEPGPNSSPDAQEGVVPGTGRTPPYDPRSPARNLSDLRICANDISIGVSGGSFTADPGNNQIRTVRGQQVSDCQIASVASLTDDKLMELYVKRGVVAPPPPMGSGTIQVGAQSPSGGGSSGAGTGASSANSAQGAAPASQLDSAAR